MSRSKTVMTDQNGLARVEGGGRGFMVLPGGTAPGGYPLTVRPGDQNPITIYGPDAVYLPPGKAFTSLELQIATVPVQGSRGGVLGTYSTYTVYLFDNEDDFIDSAGGRGSIAFNVGSFGSLPSVTPNDSGTDASLTIQSNFSALTFYFSGTAQDITVWVRSISGVWFVSEIITLSAAVAGVGAGTGGMVVTRGCYLHGGRIALTAAADSTAVVVDANVEI